MIFENSYKEKTSKVPVYHKISRQMSKEECLECMSKNTGEYMDPIEKSDGMHYYFLCEDCKHEWEIVRK